MSFYQVFQNIPFDALVKDVANTSLDKVDRSISPSIGDFSQFAALISPAAQKRLEVMAQAAHKLTIQRFGKVIQLYVPLYLSSKCQNACLYCGFRSGSNVERVTLSHKEVIKEANILKSEGFQHILLVSGEYSKDVNIKYLSEILPELKEMFPSISVEIAPQSTDDYNSLCSMGVEGVTSYQEVYQPDLYRKYHPKGTKNDFLWRISTPERAGKAGVRKIGIGSLLGLNDWRYEAISLYHHIKYMMKNFWKVQLSVSFPRLQDFGEDFEIPSPVSDIDLVQMVCALRLTFPDLLLTLSTRESQKIRDGLAKLGITQMSAGSRTGPGGYSNHREENEQFEIQDHRSPREVAEGLKCLGYDAVWKDWEATLSGSNC